MLRLTGASLAFGTGGAALAAGGYAALRDEPGSSVAEADAAGVPFYGARQAGI